MWPTPITYRAQIPLGSTPRDLTQRAAAMLVPAGFELPVHTDDHIVAISPDWTGAGFGHDFRESLFGKRTHVYRPPLLSASPIQIDIVDGFLVLHASPGRSLMLATIWQLASAAVLLVLVVQSLSVYRAVPGIPDFMPFRQGFDGPTMFAAFGVLAAVATIARLAGLYRDLQAVKRAVLTLAVELT